MNPIFAHLVGIKNYNAYTNDQNTGVKRIVDANGKEKSVKLKKGADRMQMSTESRYPQRIESSLSRT